MPQQNVRHLLSAATAAARRPTPARLPASGERAPDLRRRAATSRHRARAAALALVWGLGLGPATSATFGPTPTARPAAAAADSPPDPTPDTAPRDAAVVASAADATTDPSPTSASADAASAEPTDAGVSGSAPAPGWTVADDVTVTALRGGDQAPVSRTTLSAEELAAADHGQDLPLLLATTPSITAWADAGAGGSGYSYFSLRGIGQNRINVTLDGVPLNDPEENWVFFADLWDLASSLDSIEIQRGAGTSTVGNAAWAGAVSLASRPPAPRFGGSLRLASGGLGTRQGAVGVDSGTLLAPPGSGRGLTLYGRLSYAESDGYREHSGARQNLGFWSASWQGERDLVRLTGFSGRLRSELAYLASEESVLAANPRDNPLTPEERDDFRRDLALLAWTRALGADRTLAVTLYRNGADGWFRLWEDPGSNTRLRELGLTWEMWGGLVTFTRESARQRLDLGLHLADFTSHHRADTDVLGARAPAYRNRGGKAEANGFVKLGRELAGFRLFLDLQLRHARMDYRGSVPIPSQDWTFWNPKLGLRRALGGGAELWASVGRAQREPTRSDLFAGEDDPSLAYDLEAVRPERLDNLELGLAVTRQRWSGSLILFAMEFRDEIALTGELSEIGLPLRRNVDRSFRRGVELELTARPHPALEASLAATWIWARIAAFPQQIDVYAADGSWTGSLTEVYRDVPPLLTPEWMFQPQLAWRPLPALDLRLAARWVSPTHLDNTGDRQLRTRALWDLTFDGSWALPWAVAGEPLHLRLTVENLLDEKRRAASGYSYIFYTADGGGTLERQSLRYFYPLAERRAVVALELAF
jgi:iron complex outermembrane receptor protein